MDLMNGFAQVLQNRKIMNMLTRHRIFDIEDLVKYTELDLLTGADPVTGVQVRGRYNLGPQSVQHIKNALAQLGLKLKS